MPEVHDEFCSLHVHSEFSLLDGYGHPAQFVAQVKKLGQTAIAITDHGNISAHYRWSKECKKEGIKPILGCEMYIVEDASKKVSRQRNHITVLAKNLKGLQNLYKLVTFSYGDGFYYKPRTDWQQLKTYGDGLIITSGCPSGKTGGMIGNGAADEELIKELKWQRDNFEDWFVELCPWDYEKGKEYGSRLYKAAVKLKMPMVMTMDCHYPCREDNEVQDVLLAVQTNSKFDDPQRMRFDQKDFYIKSKDQLQKDWNRVFKGLPFRSEFISNSAKIADMVNADFPKAHSIEFPHKGSKRKLITEMVNKGMEERNLCGKKSYIKRAEYELKLIIDKGFVDYFLVIQDLVNWAKAQGIFVGPARGSSCGSLVCYLLHITEIDPLKFDLLFERFIDVNRTDMPDIDIDFEDVRRDEVKDYLRKKYGEDHVSSLLTFNTFQGRMCLQDIGRVFNIPYDTIEEVKRLVVKRSGGDQRFGFTIEDTFKGFDQAQAILQKHPSLGFASKMEGQIRNFGQHAAAVVISNEPITHFAAFYRPKGGEGERVISLDAEDAESIGLLKVDLLGLTAMTTLKKTLQLIEQRKKKKVDLSSLTFDDPKVFQMFCRGKSFGVFQFDGPASSQVCRDVQPENFDELTAINALARPGPLHSGGTQDYIERKNGKQEVKYDHPMLKEITGKTYGVTIYQEQVMMIVRQMGNFSWADTGTIRKTMSKSRGVEAFNVYEARFLEGAKKNGVSGPVAKKVWDGICTHGSWCLSGESVIINTSPNGFTAKKMTLNQLFKNNGYATSRWEEQPDAYRKILLLGMDSDGRIRPGRVKHVIYAGQKEVYELKTESGKKIKSTLQHKFLSKHGFKQLAQFSIGELIGVNAGYEQKPYLGSGGKGWRKGRKGGSGDFKDFRTVEVKEFRELHFGEPCQHCGEYKNRMEVHHVTRHAPNSILEWLCSGCHKIAEYRQGRVKVWQKGFGIKFEKIVSVTRKFKENVYDIEMEDNSRPSFVANDFVVHNSFNKSHAVAYTHIGYWMMWLKTYYPLEFYCSIMQQEADQDKLRQIVKESVREGVDVQGVDVNKSKVLFTIDGKSVRLGFSNVKGIGEKAALKLVNGQPYQSVHDFLRKVKAESIVASLMKIGACKNLSLGHKSENLSLFADGADDKVVWNHLNIRVEDLMELCPFMVQDTVMKDWTAWSQRWLKATPVPILGLFNVKKKTEVVIIGRTDPNNDYDAKNKVQEQDGKGKPMDITGHQASEYDYLLFRVEDESGSIRCYISYKDYPKLKEMMWAVKLGDVVAVKGTIGPDFPMIHVKNFRNISKTKAYQISRNAK
jgi:DNA-directed DNA polymerase III PolC